MLTKQQLARRKRIHFYYLPHNGKGEKYKESDTFLRQRFQSIKIPVISHYECDWTLALLDKVIVLEENLLFSHLVALNPNSFDTARYSVKLGIGQTIAFDSGMPMQNRYGQNRCRHDTKNLVDKYKIMCFQFVSIFVASITLSDVVVGYWYLGGVIPTYMVD